jgi:two-component system, cell cycle sensor histidine kinase and response regulator CckA
MSNNRRQMDKQEKTTPLRVLVVEDSVDDTFFIVRQLQKGGYHVDFERVETASAMQSALQSGGWDLIISDYAMPHFGGAEALEIYRRSGLEAPFIMVSGALGEERAVQMLKAGAHDYVMKNNLGRLVPAVERELQAALERRIRAQTQAHAAFLASLVESCEAAIIGKTLEGTVVSWNAGAERLYGYTAAEMLGQSVSRLVPAGRPDELAGILDRIRRGELIQDLETVRRRKDGTLVEVAITISPVKDASGRIIGASTVARDITRRKQEDNERLALIRELTAAVAHSRP